MIKEWRSDYIMVDSVGEMPPYEAGKQDPRYWDWPRTVLTYWREKIDAAGLSWPVILHSCHNGCATTFNGPTLTAAPCNGSDPRQRWKVWPNDTDAAVAEDPNAGLMHDAGSGLCAGCVLDMHYGGPACGNDAVRNASGYGLGQQACIPGTFASGQRWNYSADSRVIMSSMGSVLEVLPSPGNQVVMAGMPCLATPVSTHFHPATCIPCCGPGK